MSETSRPTSNDPALFRQEAELTPLEERCSDGTPDLDENIDWYIEEKRALAHLYPNSLVDLGRQGIVKVCVLGPDGLYDVEPEETELCPDFAPDLNENIDWYTEERRALAHLYPNSLVDLGRQGIVKVCVLGPDGLYELEPDKAEEEES